MTCIVGLQQKGRVWIGGDSAGVNSGLGLTVRADEKVFVNGDYVMGFTGSFRMGQVLRYKFKPPKPPHNNLMAFMVANFVDELREALSAAGYARKSDDVEYGGTFLVGVSGRLFTVQEDYQVARQVAGFDAVGCGADIARGAMYATRNARLKPPERVRAALAASERFSAGVRGPFRVVSK